MTYMYAVIDGCDVESKLFTVEASSQEDANVLFTQKALPIAPSSFTFDDFVRMLRDNDINVESLGEQSEAIKL